MDNDLDLGGVMDAAQAAAPDSVAASVLQDETQVVSGARLIGDAQTAGAATPSPDAIIRAVDRLEPKTAGRMAHMLRLMQGLPEALLISRWKGNADAAFQPDLLEPLLANTNVREVVRGYVDALSERHGLDRWTSFAALVRDPVVSRALAESVPTVVAGLFGSGDFSVNPSKNGTALNLRAATAISDYLHAYERDPENNPLPSSVALALQIAIPAVVGAAFDRYVSHPPKWERNVTAPEAGAVRMDPEILGPSSLADVFSADLVRYAPRRESVAVQMAHHLAGGGRHPELVKAIASGKLDEFVRIAGGSAASEHVLNHVQRMLAETPGVDSGYASFLAEHTLGSSRRLNGPDHLWFGADWNRFPELSDANQMMDGLLVPHKVTLPQGLSVYQPFLVLDSPYRIQVGHSVDGSAVFRNVSLLEVVYGLSAETIKVLRQVLIGEAALVNFSDAQARSTYELLKSALAAGESIDSPRSVLRDQLIGGHVIEPGKVLGKKDTVAERMMVDLNDALQRDGVQNKELGGKTALVSFETGPIAFKKILRALGAEDPALGELLQAHAVRFQERAAARGLRSRATSGADALAVSRARQEIVRGLLTGRTLADVLELKQVPLLRVKGLAPGETVEKDADGAFYMQLAVAQAAMQLVRDSKEISVQGNEQNSSAIDHAAAARLQTLFGYYILGPEIYQRLQLPYRRSVQPPPRLEEGGLVRSLSGKTGLIRSTFFGSRLDNSARLKILPNVNQPIDAVTIPPYVMAVVRGDFIATILRDVKPEMSEVDITERALMAGLAGLFSRQTKRADFSANLAQWSASLMRRVEMKATKATGSPEAGALAAEKMRGAIERFVSRIPHPYSVDARRLMLGEKIDVGAFSAKGIQQHIAKALLEHRQVAEVLKFCNDHYPAVISRYPVIHHHSFVTVNLRQGATDENVISIHPLIAGGLNADFDGDNGDLFFPLPYSASKEQAAAWKQMMDSHSPVHAVLNSASGTDWIFRLTLNAAEGLVKANGCVARGFGSESNGVVHVDATIAEDALRNVLPNRDVLLQRFLEDPATLLKLQGEWLDRLRAESGLSNVRLTAQVGRPDGAVTTFSRLFLHEVLTVLTGSAERTAAAVGPRYLLPGEASDIAPVKGVERILQQHCFPDEKGSVNPGQHIAVAYTNFYALFAAESVTTTHSAREQSLNTQQMLEYIARDGVVDSLRRLFSARTSSLEQAATAGVLTNQQVGGLLARVEHGERSPEEKDHTVRGADGMETIQKGFNTLLREYRQSDRTDEGVALQRATDFIMSRMSNPAYGIKPLMKLAIRLSCEKFARDFGYPHMLVEQVLVDKVKAADEVMFRIFLGTTNTVQGEATISSKGGLVFGATAERILQAGPAAIEKAAASKTEVVDPGVSFKDYVQMLGMIYVTKQSDRGPTLDFKLADYESAGALNYLVHQLSLRRFELSGPGLTPDEAAAATKRLVDLVERVPFDRAEMARALKELAVKDPAAVVHARSVLFDINTGRGVSAESVGYLTVAGPEGLRFDENGVARRRPFSERNYLNYPVGAIYSGGMAEIATQAALRMRHVNNGGVEEYSHLGDWHRVVHGPYPTRSPFFRQGGERLRSANPLAIRGLEGHATAFTARVPGAPDCALTLAKKVQHIQGVEVFPGEHFVVKDGRIHVGTSRPASWSVPVDMDAGAFRAKNGALRRDAELEGDTKKLRTVVPVEFQIALSAEEAERMNLGLHDKVAAYRATPQLGKGARALRTGGAVMVSVPIVTGQVAVSKLAAGLGLDERSVAQRIRVPVAAEYRKVTATEMAGPQWAWFAEKGLVRYQVAGNDPVQIGKGSPLMPGMVVDPETGLASKSISEEVSRGMQGFGAYLGFISGKPLDTRSPLSFYTGTVDSVKYIARRGETSDYEVKVRGENGIAQTQVVRLPDSDLPAIVEGQRVERGSPLGFGAVTLKERCDLRGEQAMLDVAQYLCASSYSEGKRSPAPVLTELLTRVLFVNGKFVPISEQNRTLEREVSSSPWLRAIRVGSVRELVAGATSPTLAKSSGGLVVPNGRDPIDHQVNAVDLFPTPHPAQWAHTSVVAERLKALGLDGGLMQPLDRAAQDFTRNRLAKAAEPASAEVTSERLPPPSPTLLDR